MIWDAPWLTTDRFSSEVISHSHDLPEKHSLYVNVNYSILVCTHSLDFYGARRNNGWPECEQHSAQFIHRREDENRVTEGLTSTKTAQHRQLQLLQLLGEWCCRLSSIPRPWASTGDKQRHLVWTRWTTKEEYGTWRSLVATWGTFRSWVVWLLWAVRSGLGGFVTCHSYLISETRSCSAVQFRKTKDPTSLQKMGWGGMWLRLVLLHDLGPP